jgi:hypothetical protein
MPDRSEALPHSACRQSLLQIEDVHFGEPGAVGLLLEDTDGISRQLRRLAGLVDDGERPARFLIGEAAGGSGESLKTNAARSRCRGDAPASAAA